MFTMLMKKGEIDAYARVFEEGVHWFWSSGYQLSLRGQGLGGQLIREILQLCAEKWPGKEIEIEAQDQVAAL